MDIELSTTPTFAPGSGEYLVYTTKPSDPQKINNSPRGFFRFDPSAGSWSTLVQFATSKNPSSPRVYYRVRQCQQGGAFCVYSSEAAPDESNSTNVPYVLLDDSAVLDFGGCTLAGGSRRGVLPMGLLLVILAGGLGRRQRREAS